MPDIMIRLGICGGLGALNGLARMVILARRAGQNGKLSTYPGELCGSNRTGPWPG